MASHNFQVCRRVYEKARKSLGCPKVVTQKLGPGYVIAQTEDGDTTVQVDECCAWAGKYKCVQEWRRKHHPGLDD